MHGVLVIGWYTQLCFDRHNVPEDHQNPPDPPEDHQNCQIQKFQKRPQTYTHTHLLLYIDVWSSLGLERTFCCSVTPWGSVWPNLRDAVELFSSAPRGIVALKQNRKAPAVKQQEREILLWERSAIIIDPHRQSSAPDILHLAGLSTMTQLEVHCFVMLRNNN